MQDFKGHQHISLYRLVDRSCHASVCFPRKNHFPQNFLDAGLYHHFLLYN